MVYVKYDMKKKFFTMSFTYLVDFGRLSQSALKAQVIALNIKVNRSSLTQTPNMSVDKKPLINKVDNASVTRRRDLRDDVRDLRSLVT